MELRNGPPSGCLKAAGGLTAGPKRDLTTADVTERNSRRGVTTCWLNNEPTATGPLTARGQLGLSEPRGGSGHSPDQPGFQPESLYSFPFARTTLTAGERLRPSRGTEKKDGEPKLQSTQRKRTWGLLWEWLRRNFWKLHLFLQEH